MSLRWSAGVWTIRFTGTRRLWRLTDDGWERRMWMGREVKDSRGRGREDEAGLERARREGGQGCETDEDNDERTAGHPQTIVTLTSCIYSACIHTIQHQSYSDQKQQSSLAGSQCTRLCDGFGQPSTSSSTSVSRLKMPIVPVEVDSQPRLS